jgi:hypothetical protein
MGEGREGGRSIRKYLLLVGVLFCNVICFPFLRAFCCCLFFRFAYFLFFSYGISPGFLFIYLPVIFCVFFTAFFLLLLYFWGVFLGFFLGFFFVFF